MNSNKKSKADKIFYQLAKEADDDKRGPVTFSLNLKLYGQFKKECEGKSWPMSQVVEKLLREFVEGK